MVTLRWRKENGRKRILGIVTRYPKSEYSLDQVLDIVHSIIKGDA